MQIVPKGSPKPEREIQYLCDDKWFGCNTEFRFYESEGKTGCSMDGRYVTIACPSCNKLYSIWLGN